MYLEGQAGLSSLAGPYARVEAGWRPIDPLALVGFAQWSRAESVAGIGARLSF